jgi:hypothetical protein
MPTPQGRPASPYLACGLAWAVPGGGHFWLGRRQKGVALFVLIPVLFILGLWLDGEFFPFDFADPLVGLKALADHSIGLMYFAAQTVGAGQGRAASPTYEYGNTFMIVAGLLNLLSALDAFDIAVGRK